MKRINNSTKSEIRKMIYDKRKAMTLDFYEMADRKITEAVMKSAEYKQAENILIYKSMAGEVKTDDIINGALKDGKRVALPRVLPDHQMIFIEIRSLEEDTVPKFMGILEPKDELDTELREGLMIMPGVAFSKKGERIGYGGGYYDRYMEKNDSLKTMALAYEFQIFEALPSEETDQKPQKIITETCKRILDK